VEDHACFDVLAEMECDVIRGWFTREPMSAQAFFESVSRTDMAPHIRLKA
jgi:EAL domain-containing protein (putative c-di-GMP-specific phosphodiesterase class I)